MNTIFLKFDPCMNAKGIKSEVFETYISKK